MSKPRWLLKADEIAAMPGETRVHFLNANAVRENKSLGDAVGMKNLGFHLVSLAPGRDSTEYHRHHYEDECIYVLDGRGYAVIDTRRHEIGPGDFLGFPSREVAHSLHNDGERPLLLLVAGQRLAMEICDYPNLQLRLYARGSERDVVDLRHIQQHERQPHRGLTK